MIETALERRVADALPDDPTFPHNEWERVRARYTDYWRWFLGQPLEEKSETSGQALFPLEINPVNLFAAIHAAVLIGEVPDGPDPPIKTTVRARRAPGEKRPPQEWVRRAEFVEDFVNRVWEENNGAALQTEAALISQFLGGAAWRVTWTPFSDRQQGIRVELIYPDQFVPVYSGTEYWDLLECWLLYQISAQEAKALWGVDASADWVLYRERWTPKERYFFVDDQKVDYAPRGIASGDRNSFGFVPFTYIPVLRAGGFYGLSIVNGLKGLVRELNRAEGDVSDAVRKMVRRMRYMRNVSGDITRRTYGDLVFYDLGRQTPGSTEAARPDVFLEDAPGNVQSAYDFPEDLWRVLLRIGRISNIALGEDEGSQRSALTLAFRMWPVTSRARQSRMYQRVGFRQIAHHILALARSKGLIEDLPDDYNKYLQIHHEFAPLIPRDAEQELNKLTLAKQSGGISMETFIEELGYVKDVDTEMEQILAWDRKQAELQRAQQPFKQGPLTDVQQPVAATVTE